MGLLSAVRMHHIGHTLRTDVANQLRETLDADKLQDAAEKFSRLTPNYVRAVQEHRQAEIVRLQAEVDALFDEVSQVTSRLDETIEPQPANIAHDSPDWEERHLLELVEQQAQLSHQLWSELKSQIDSNGGGTQIDSAILDRLTAAAGSLLKHSQDLEHLNKDQMTRALQATQDQVTTSVRILMSVAVLAVIISLVLGWLVAIPLVARLARLRDGAAEIGKGNLEVRIKVETGDEIGQLASAFNEMAVGLRRSRDEIRENESKFRELAESIHEVFWIVSPDCSKLYYVSPAYEEVWGRTVESVYTNCLSFTDAIIPDDRPRIIALQKMATDGFDVEYRIVRPDGTIRWIHSRGSSVCDQTGQVARIVGIAADVTRQKLAEEALRNAHAELEERVEVRTAELRSANDALLQTERDLQHSKDAAEVTARLERRF